MRTDPMGLYAAYDAVNRVWMYIVEIVVGMYTLKIYQKQKALPGTKLKPRKTVSRKNRYRKRFWCGIHRPERIEGPHGFRRGGNGDRSHVGKYVVRLAVLTINRCAGPTYKGY